MINENSLKVYISIMSHFTAEELDKYDVEELRKILKNIYDRILATKKTDRKDIEKSISGAIKNRSVSYKLMGSSTLRNFIKNPTYKPNRASEKIIGFIRFLSETYNIQMQIDEVVDYYDIFYWRTDGSGGNGKAGKETIGVARLKITNWKDAELKYFYHSQKAPYAYLTGKVEMYNNGIHLYLEDGTGTERDP
ncbi:MAG: hypothetical protein R2822_16675 [Spirosomataceae bacterium]